MFILKILKISGSLVIIFIIITIFSLNSTVFKREFFRQTSEDGKTSVVFYTLPTFDLISRRNPRGWVKVINNRNGEILCEGYLTDAIIAADNVEHVWFPDDIIIGGGQVMCEIPE